MSLSLLQDPSLPPVALFVMPPPMPLLSPHFVFPLTLSPTALLATHVARSAFVDYGATYQNPTVTSLPEVTKSTASIAQTALAPTTPPNDVAATAATEEPKNKSAVLPMPSDPTLKLMAADGFPRLRTSRQELLIEKIIKTAIAGISSNWENTKENIVVICSIHSVGLMRLQNKVIVANSYDIQRFIKTFPMERLLYIIMRVRIRVPSLATLWLEEYPLLHAKVVLHTV